MGAEGYGEELECHQRNPETLKGKNKVETPSYNQKHVEKPKACIGTFCGD